jgi:hypothetical protein
VNDNLLTCLYGSSGDLFYLTLMREANVGLDKFHAILRVSTIVPYIIFLNMYSENLSSCTSVVLDQELNKMAFEAYFYGLFCKTLKAL